MDGQREKIECDGEGDVGRGGRDWPRGYLASGGSKSQGTAWTESDWSFVGLQSRDENERDAVSFPEALPEPWSAVPNGLFSHHTIHTGWRPAGLSKQKHARTERACEIVG